MSSISATPHRKVLIIKTGFSETFTPEIQEATVSLGDVLRTTALLHLFEFDSVTWLTSEKAAPLLYNNRLIKEVLIYNLSSVLRLEQEHFDIVINLEKIPGLCALSDSIRAWQRYGFRFDPTKGCAEAYLQSTEALYIANDMERKRVNRQHWLEMLYKMVGYVWYPGFGYVMPEYAINPAVPRRVGLNCLVGDKFVDKAWKGFGALNGELLLRGIPVSIQPGTTTIKEYIEWLSTNEVIVTNDSLGLHLALGLNRKVVGLFGPTPAHEIQPYDKGIMIQKDKINDITVEEVCEAVECLLKKS